MTAYKPGDPTTINRLYGRAKGKPLRQGQQALVDELLPQIAMPAEGPITAEALFGEPRPLHSKSALAGASTWRSAPTCCPTMVSSGQSPS